MKPHHYRLGYRSDIEGLRAVAILLVVAAHARVAWLAGGFVGVDVFFVLSGYLITGLLVQEIQGTGELRFAAFYARRLRRLLPALLLMLAGTCILGWLLTAPADQPGQATAAASAAVWASNFYFAFSHLAYFSPGAETNLFLHTWSLGVEEQFYLVWPVFLVLALGAWTGTRRSSSPARLKIAMLAIFSISLVLCVLWTRSAPRLAFYMMPSRAWQFALGALVFLYFGAPAATAGDGTPLEGLAKSRRTAMLRLAGWLGLGLIAAAALLLDGDMPYPGTWALLPALGAATILAAGARSSTFGVGRVLSVRPLQAIGRVSYAWYLWHWPVLLLGATLVDMHSAANRFGLVVLSFVFAVLSYYVLETPIRRNPRLVARPRMAVLSALALMFVAGVLAIYWHNGAQYRMTQPEQLRYVQVRSDAPVIYRMGCDDWYHSAEVRICAFGPAHARHTAVAIGDSVALQWFPAFAEVFDKPGWRLLVITKSSCPMVDEPLFYPRIGRQYTECGEWRKNALRRIAALKPDLVILGSTYTYDFTQSQWTEGTKRVLRSLSASTAHIYILRSTPIMPFDGPACLAPRSKLYAALSISSQCIALANNVRSDNVYRWLGEAATNFANVELIDMTDTVCPRGQCRAQQRGIIVFRDSQHMTATFARSLGAALATRLDLNTGK
ncbi:acyltransferase family protein [Dyella sp.]|uniref:acyltransferase family protein n=1 Tax=Dyella sp. TaxID=1869338 RepID=UPI002D7865C6|nr:acyltransferase family protein [Dyella sp.]HET7332165.1 acyltransferase family protein [Dyella sp.]